jgi:hypothetical protein
LGSHEAQSIDATAEIASDAASRPGRATFAWRLALALAGVAAIAVTTIVATRPAEGQSISERVTAAIQEQATCTDLGLASLAGSQHTVYRCVVGQEAQGLVRCFAYVDGGLRQFVDSRQRC